MQMLNLFPYRFLRTAQGSRGSEHRCFRYGLAPQGADMCFYVTVIWGNGVNPSHRGQAAAKSGMWCQVWYWS